MFKIRENFSAYVNEKLTNMNAVFDRFGYKRGHNPLSVLLNNVSYEGKILTQHAWVSCKEEFKNIEINRGDLISFDGYIGNYRKSSGCYDYGIQKIENVRVIKSNENKLCIDDVKYFSFEVKEKRDVWNHIKGNKKEFIHDSNREIQRDMTIISGDIVEIELEKIDKYGDMYFAWKVERHKRWNQRAIFNPLQSGQALIIYGKYQLFLPENIYFKIKDFYFKYKFSKSNIELPFENEMIHYEKPPNFKHRYFINYDENGNMIKDEILADKRLSVFQRREEILRSMTDDEIFAFTQEVFNSVVYIKSYKSEKSENYQNYEFLITKMLNTFNSADDKGKSRFIRIMLEKEETKIAQI